LHGLDAWTDIPTRVTPLAGLIGNINLISSRVHALFAIFTPIMFPTAQCPWTGQKKLFPAAFDAVLSNGAVEEVQGLQ